MKTDNSKGILIVDDDRDIAQAAGMALRPLGASIELLNEPRQLLSRIDSGPVDAILLDMNFTAGSASGSEGLQLLDVLVHRCPDVSVVLMTAYGGVQLAVDALKRGASDFVLKPWQNEKLVATMTAALALTQAKRAAAQREMRHDTLALESASQRGGVRLQSARFAEIDAVVRRAAPTDADILLLGESGTGKEVTARAIHQLSRRAREPFVSVDLGAVPESLFESELFGALRGSFTGAAHDRVGRIEAADRGTLFLDEIGNLPVHLQSKLLTVLERREVMPLGATKPIPIDVRLISATNLTREELSQPSRFRQDLLFRIMTVQIVLPPLRERREDIIPLLEHFLEFYAQKHRVRRKPLTPEARALLESYAWPGNIRELRHAAESATILAAGAELVPEDFAFARTRQAVAGESAQFDLEQIEREAIRRALEHYDGNISQAAIALGLTRPALYRRITRHGL